MGRKLILLSLLSILALIAPPQIATSAPIISQPQPEDATPESPSFPPPYLSDADVADAPFGSPSPNVEGFLSPGEYARAHRLTFLTYGGLAEAFIFQNATTLFIAISSPNPAPYPTVTGGGTGPALQVFLDTNHDGGAVPQLDDFRLTLVKNGNSFENQGNGSSWGGNTPPVNWSGATQSFSWGWQGEFAIDFAKLGVMFAPSKVFGLALAEVWTPNWPLDYYWPRGGFYNTPSTWGKLLSSSEWTNFYWKPGAWQDYAPSGMPDISQRSSPNWAVQIDPQTTRWTHCGPVAAANSLWWFDSKFETPNHAPPVISDTYRLVRGMLPGNDDHDPINAINFVDLLANNYFGTNQGGIRGTSIISMTVGMNQYLRDRGLWDDYSVTLVAKPDFLWVADQVQRSEDVILLLGFWQNQPQEGWVRLGGHYVTVAGVQVADQGSLIAFSDPYLDARELGLSPGRVMTGTLITHVHPPPSQLIGLDPVHTDAGNVSHDAYPVIPTDSPGGTWGPYAVGLIQYVLPWVAGVNPHPVYQDYPMASGDFQVEVEFALAVSPFNWKRSGHWHPLTETWKPLIDYAPNGVPDFDQKQDSWGVPPGSPPPPQKYTFCGPVAAANSLWWYDTIYEPSPVFTSTLNDHYPLVSTYSSMPPFFDDHVPGNVDLPGTLWPPGGEFVEDLARRFNTDPNPIHAGTVITDVQTGLVNYLKSKRLDHHYTITQVQKPEFWWVAQEVERSEDVILLLGFWQNQPQQGWVRLGGHYVTVAGVDRKGGYIAFSDPWFDRIEQTWPFGGSAILPGFPVYTGRVANGAYIFPHAPIPGHNTLMHNDAGNVSHDIYRVQATLSPGGTWGPMYYALSWGQIENFWGQNGTTGTPTVTGDPITTEVEWAIAVSPARYLLLPIARKP